MVRRVGGQASGRAGKRVGRWADGQVGGWADSRRLPFYSRNATPVIPRKQFCVAATVLSVLSKIVTSVVCALWDLIDHDKTET